MTNDFDDFPDDDFKELIAEVKAAGEVPEPSPLFWNHLSARVRESVAVEPVPRSWWTTYWRPVAVAVGTVCLLAIVVLRPWPPTVPSVPSTPSITAAPDVAADVEVSEMWRLIEVAAPAVEMDSVRDAGFMPSQYATDQAIESLTPSQREALVKLLRKEMGVSE
jgi:hypothetical protein